MLKNIFSLLHKKSPNDNPSERGKSLSASIGFMVAQHLWLRILIGMVLGMSLGLALSPLGGGIIENTDTAKTVGSWISLPGVIFIGLLKMVIIPLVICSIILGINTSGDLGFLKQMGIRIIPYFVLTTAISIGIGLTLANTIKPGQYIDPQMLSTVIGESEAGSKATGQRTFDDLTIPQRIGNLIPTNFTRAQLEGNLLQIVIASIIIGIVVITIPSSTIKPFLDLCTAGQMISMKIVSWTMLLAPYAVFGLLCNITLQIGIDALIGVGVYTATVILGLVCMLIAYMIILKTVSGRSPIAFLKAIRSVQLLAFSTSSSAAVMPLSIQAAEENLNISPEISRFVVPLGATINMDGTALYQGVAAIFLCQVFGIDLSLGEMVLLLITTVGASIGTPAVPSAGIVVLATILTGIGVPVEGIGLILGVDRILDMCRTTINVTGDLTAATVMQKWLAPSLSKTKAGNN